VADVVQKTLELFSGRVVPEWYMKLEEGYADSWEEKRRQHRPAGVESAKQYWTELSLSLLMQPKPDKGMLRTAIEGTKIGNKDLHQKLKDKLRILR
tara:strand:+ start:81 stop:368 length:288 start_codon:yes stop_codon:yes gene_type:complete